MDAVTQLSLFTREPALDAMPPPYPEQLVDGHPIYLYAPLCLVRDRAAGKVYHGPKRLTCARSELLAVVADGSEFDAIAYAFREHRWSDVFRDLLCLQREGVIAYRGDDRWGPP